MINDLVDNALGNGPRREFTSQDYATYMQRLAPYRAKVVDRKELLTPEDVQHLRAMEIELSRTYTPESLSQLRIYGKIGIITGLNDVRVEARWEDELDREHHNLSNELELRRAKGTLSPEEKKRIYERIDRICYLLDPWHYHRVEGT